MIYGGVSSIPVGFVRQEAKMDVPLQMNSGIPGKRLITLQGVTIKILPSQCRCLFYNST